MQTAVRARPEKAVFLAVEADGSHGVLAAVAGQPAVAGEQQESGKREQERGAGEAAHHDAAESFQAPGLSGAPITIILTATHCLLFIQGIAPCLARRCDRNRRRYDPSAAV